MILAIDVGNTNITIGLVKNDEIIGVFRMNSDIHRTSDEYGIFINQLILTKGLIPSDIDDAVIASVVPNVMYSLNSAMIKYFNINPMIVGSGVKTGIKIKSANPREVGADRIAKAAAAATIYKGNIIVVDFGTVSTYDLINEEAEFIAGVTAPGIKSCAQSMSSSTASLPVVELKLPETILARDTVTSIQAGVIYGAIGQAECIIRNMKKECGLSDIKTVATGDFGKLVMNATDCIDLFDPDLSLKGLNIIYKKNSKNADKRKTGRS